MGKDNDKGYEVGFSKPPKSGQFKPGKSGNSRGRPKGSKNLATLFQEKMKQRVNVRENGVLKKVPVGEAIVAKMFEKALNGNMRDMLAFMKEASRIAPELLEDQGIPEKITIEFVEAGEIYTQEEYEEKWRREIDTQTTDPSTSIDPVLQSGNT